MYSEHIKQKEVIRPLVLEESSCKKGVSGGYGGPYQGLCRDKFETRRDFVGMESMAQAF